MIINNHNIQMKTTKLKFVFILIGFAIAFLISTKLLLNQPIEAMFGSLTTQYAWQATLSTLLSPIKIILIGPLLPFIDFLRQDPDTPPPFFLMGFAMYWTILALLIHYLISKLNPYQSSQI